MTLWVDIAACGVLAAHSTASASAFAALDAADVESNDERWHRYLMFAAL